MHSVCPSQILHKPLFSNAPLSTLFSQEHLKTLPYAKIKGGKRGQTECIIGHPKIKYSVSDCLP